METMDDRLEYRNDTTGRYSEATTRWQLRAASALSFESGDSGDSYTPQDQHLQYFPQKETRTLRRLIPATWPEVLSYYRSFVTATCKTQMLSMQYVQFNGFFWYYILTLFFKSLPHTYVHVFLASYSKDEHFFVAKMIPIAYGLIFIYIITAFVQIMMYMTTLILLLDYTMKGLADRNPWNRCTNQTYRCPILKDYIHCYESNEFASKFINKTTIYAAMAYLVKSGNLSEDEDKQHEFIHLPPFIYFLQRTDEFNEPTFYGSLFYIYFICLWLLINLFHRQLFSRYIWKTHHIVQWAINFIYMCIFIHLAQDYFFGQLENKIDVRDGFANIHDVFWSADFNMLSESMTAPPIIHILTTRSSRETQPSGDSSVIIISNGIYYMFRGFLSYLMKKYIDSKVHVYIHFINGSPYNYFCFWPIYFSKFYLDSLFSATFFFLHFLMDFFTIVITYQCLIEAIVCQWRFAKRLVVTLIFFILGLLVFYYSNDEERINHYVYTQGAATMLEIIAIYVIYPIDRLIDDITFFTGVIPTRIRILNLRLVPFYYAIKLYIMFNGIYVINQSVRDDTDLFMFFISLLRTDFALIVVLLIGAFIATFKYVYKQKKPCKSLIIPDANWGPEYSVRQIRKEYDSREYVGSQAPQQLSRYMIQKAEAKKYTLNIKYDASGRTSTYKEAPAQFMYEDEKKNL